jgi:hypothetical protein
VVREGGGRGGGMTQALYAHMNNKARKKKKCSHKVTSLILSFQRHEQRM